MPYPTTFPPAAADQDVIDLAGRACARLTGPGEVARRLAALDEAYIRSHYVPLDELAAGRPGGAAAIRKLIAAGMLPQPAYRLDDGTDMVAADYFAPLDAAGSVADLEHWFCNRYREAATRYGLPDGPEAAAAQWADYLTGGYSVCLLQATPESIAQKASYITAIERLLARPEPEAAQWGSALRTAVAGLAAIERPGSPLDPPRWGGPMSPQWYGAYLRAYYPQVFVETDLS